MNLSKHRLLQIIREEISAMAEADRMKPDSIYAGSGGRASDRVSPTTDSAAYVDQLATGGAAGTYRMDGASRRQRARIANRDRNLGGRGRSKHAQGNINFLKDVGRKLAAPVAGISGYKGTQAALGPSGLDLLPTSADGEVHGWDAGIALGKNPEMTGGTQLGPGSKQSGTKKKQIRPGEEGFVPGEITYRNESLTRSRLQQMVMEEIDSITEEWELKQHLKDLVLREGGGQPKWWPSQMTWRGRGNQTDRQLAQTVQDWIRGGGNQRARKYDIEMGRESVPSTRNLPPDLDDIQRRVPKQAVKTGTKQAAKTGTKQVAKTGLKQAAKKALTTAAVGAGGAVAAPVIAGISAYDTAADIAAATGVVPTKSSGKGYGVADLGLAMGKRPEMTGGKQTGPRSIQDPGTKKKHIRPGEEGFVPGEITYRNESLTRSHDSNALERMVREEMEEYLSEEDNSFSKAGEEIEKKGTEGVFTAKAKKAGMGVQAYADKVLAKDSKASTKTKRQAAFARGAATVARKNK